MCDTPVQTLTHRTGAPTPAFPDMVHDAPLFTGLTRLCVAPGKGDTVTAFWKELTQSYSPLAGLRVFPDLTVSNKTEKALGERL